MRKNWFIQTLAVYIPVILFIVFALLTVFFVTLSGYFKQEAVRANTVYSRQVMNLLDLSLHSVDELVTNEIFANYKLAEFFDKTSNTNQFLLEKELSERLSEMIGKVSLIDTIYLIRKSDRTVLSNQMMIHLDEFGDKPFAESVLDGQVSYQWSDMRSYKPFPNNGDSDYVISLVRKAPYVNGAEGYVVVNVKRRSIEGLMEASGSGKYNFVVLTDNKQQSLFQNETDSIPSDHKSAVQSDYTGWTIQSGFAEQHLVKFIFTSLQSLLLAFLIICSGIGGIVFLTHRNYKPIKSIVTRIGGYPQKTERAASANSELGMIETALDDLIRQSHAFEKRHEENIAYKRKYFFLQLIKGTRTVDLKEWHSEMQELLLPDRFGRLSVMVLEIDRYRQFCAQYNDKDQTLYKYVLAQLMKETSAKQELICWMEWTGDNELSIIFQHIDVKNAHKNVMNVGEETVQWINRHLSFTVTMGASSIVQTVENIADCYEQAREALSYKCSLGDNRTIWHLEVEHTPPEQSYSYYSHIQEMSRLFRIGDSGWRTQFDLLFDSLQSRLLSTRDFHGTVQYFLYHFQLGAAELPEEVGSIWSEQAVPLIHECMQDETNISDFRDCLLRIMEDSAARISAARSGRSNSALVNEMKTYIEMNFANPNISLVYLSELYRVSPNHISKIIKDELGENFIDYLTHVRIEHAKRMLEQTSTPINEIAEQAGYANVISFNRVFKKLTGYPPGGFRKKAAETK